MSGESFLLDVGFGGVRVYRTADLQIVDRWEKKGWEDLPAVGFIDAHTAFEFGDGSRIRFREW